MLLRSYGIASIPPRDERASLFSESDLRFLLHGDPVGFCGIDVEPDAGHSYDMHAEIPVHSAPLMLITFVGIAVLLRFGLPALAGCWALRHILHI